MSERKPPGESLYRGPAAAPRDKRERARQMQTREGKPALVRKPDEHERVERARAEFVPELAVALEAFSPRALREQRIYGLNACLALFAKRPEALRKVWLLESRIPKLQKVLAFCVKQRLGYTVVEEGELEKISGSAHHEGVCFGALPMQEHSLANWLHALPSGPAVALWLDGVGNPHNLGAILRSAAHFGVAAVLLPKNSSLAISGAAARVAEGGSEQVSMVRLGPTDQAISQLHSAGFTLAASLVRDATSLYSTKLPERLALVMGAEQLGVANELACAAKLRLSIPSSGAVESLNVSAATAVFLGEWWRQQHKIE